MSRTCGLSSQLWMTGPGRAQNTLSVPAGAPISSRAGTTSSRIANITPSGALRGALSTTVLPASRGRMPNRALLAGAFCGGLTATTPSGTRRSSIRRPPCSISCRICAAHHSSVCSLKISSRPATCHWASERGVPSAVSSSTNSACRCRSRRLMPSPSAIRARNGRRAHNGAAAAAASVASATRGASATAHRPTTKPAAAGTSAVPRSSLRLSVRLSKTSSRIEEVVTV